MFCVNKVVTCKKCDNFTVEYTDEGLQNESRKQWLEGSYYVSCKIA